MELSENILMRMCHSLARANVARVRQKLMIATKPSSKEKAQENKVYSIQRFDGKSHIFSVRGVCYDNLHNSLMDTSWFMNKENEVDSCVCQ
jgi:hypothetical protein